MRFRDHKSHSKAGFGGGLEVVCGGRVVGVGWVCGSKEHLRTYVPCSTYILQIISKF